MHPLNRFLKYLRGLDEPSKRTWVGILSGTTMIFIVVIWVISLSITVKNISSPNDKISLAKENQVSLGIKIKRGLGNAYVHLHNLLERGVNKKNEIIIENK